MGEFERPRAERLRAVNALVLLVAATVACGQKSGVHVAGQEGGPGIGPGTVASRPASSSAADGIREPADGHGSGTQIAGLDGRSSYRGSARTGGTGAFELGSASGGDRPAAARREPTIPVPDASGELRIGIHAPATGAGPLPIDAFERTIEVYWRWQTEVKERRILGRDRVEPIFRDDKYNVETATQVCRELAAKAFIVFGGGGTDQIAACGRYLDSQQVPYVSGGVTEAGLAELQWYFAAWMTYPQQMELLAQIIAERFPGKKAAMIATDTMNFDDAVVAWEHALRRRGIPYHRTLRHPKNDEAWYGHYAVELRQRGVEIVLPLTAATSYIKFSKAAYHQGYRPQFLGVGIGYGFDSIAYVACPAGDGSLHLSPFPAMDRADEFDPEFREALAHFGVDEDEVDDFAWVVWGASRLTHAMFDRLEELNGTALDRGAFRRALESGGEIDGGIYPPVRFAPGQHLGGRSMHLLRAECGAVGGRYVTDGTYLRVRPSS